MRNWAGSFKLLLVLALLVTVGLLPAESWPAIGLVGVVAYLLHAAAGTPGRTMWRRAWPFLLTGFALAGAALFSQPGPLAATAAIALILRMTTAFLAGLWLSEVMSAAELMQTLRRWRCPALFVTLIGFLLRYLVVLWEEHGRLERAQQARGGGPADGWPAWKAAIDRTGMLVLRALDRAERTHRAMLARGWTGSEP